MTRMHYDAIVVGAGPNGLAAAIRFAQAGRRVRVVEACDAIGGAVGSVAATLPGFVHDRGAAAFPLSVASPFLRTLPLERFGLRWAHAPLPLAHPLDGGRAVVTRRSVAQTAAALGRDRAAYAQLMQPMVRWWQRLMPTLLAPVIPPRLSLHGAPALPALAQFGALALLPATLLARLAFREPATRALFAGHAAHSILPLARPLTAAYGMILGASAHAVGWPMVMGGAAGLANALAEYLRSLGGTIETGCRVDDLDDLPPAEVVFLDVGPAQALHLAGSRMAPATQRALRRFRHGPGVFKVDWALNGPIPWQAGECRLAGTLHLGGTLEEIAYSEAAVWRGEHTAQPYVLLGQPSLFDASRAPVGNHTAWAYCHVPHGSTRDMTALIEDQIERFAPGFRSRILARSTMHSAALEAHNANLVGGDIAGGAQDLPQLVARPTLSLNPYRLAPGIYLCSASTPPGAGVHGMCGFHAAEAALRELGAILFK
jgi:phytoene dehydrogenase-like protein